MDPFLPGQAEILDRMNREFTRHHWQVKRRLVRTLQDTQSFIPASIVAILDHCRIDNAQTLAHIDRVRSFLKQCRKGHLGYHWPLTRGRSRLPNAPWLSRVDALGIDADADCTCLHQIVLKEENIVEKILEELSFYRLDFNRFRLPLLQQELPNARGSFLTWFPPKEQCHGGKLESIDVAACANVLWYLGTVGRLDTPGAQETMGFVRAILASDLIMSDPFKVSPYYPYPLAILYNIARAIAWGKLDALKDCRERILGLVELIEPRSCIDRVLYAGIGTLLGNSITVRRGLGRHSFWAIANDPFYVWPAFFSLAHRTKRIFNWLAQWPVLHVKFSCKALVWAMLLWITQQLDAPAGDSQKENPRP